MERYDIRVNVWGDVSGPQYEWETVKAEDGDFVLYADAQATVEALQAQLREGEAAYHNVGEYNDRLKQQVEALQRERDEAIREHGKESGFWGRTCARLLDKRDKLQTALDAEREKVRRRTEECNEISRLCVDSQTQLTQLQALVRALPVVETELSDKHRAIHISASISINSEVHGLVDPLKALLDYRRTLDATTPEEAT